MENWYPIKFEPDVERIYAKHLLARFIPLVRLASGIGIAAFIGYQFWDLMLDPQAFSKTGPVRLAAILHFVLCIGLSYLPTIRSNPRVWLPLLLYTYLGYMVLLILILSRLPNGFVAGSAGIMLGMIFIPAITNGARQASGVLVAQLIVALITMAFLGGTKFELINVLAWSGGGVGFAVGFAFLLDVINRRAYQFERQLNA